MKHPKAYLHFEDGTCFPGKLITQDTDKELQVWGEAAFTTSMTGYQESMTDPSYLGQHLIFATSHVGNYPAQEHRKQSNTIPVASIIMRTQPHNAYILNCGRPILYDVDTRELVKFLTKYPKHKSVITRSTTPPTTTAFAKTKLNCQELKLVSQNEIEWIQEGEHPIVVVNYGIKTNILNHLKALNLPMVTVPYHMTAKNILDLNPRLIFLSNGPGDPREYKEEIEQVKELLQSSVPIRAICLGHQLLCLALGAKVNKLPFGHRGSNHPILDLKNDRVLISSQNHGYAVQDDQLTSPWKEESYAVTYRSLFDQSVEGIQSLNGRVKTVQHHPEACPGPVDAEEYFAEIENYLQSPKNENFDPEKRVYPKSLDDLKEKLEIPYKKVLVIGSGPIKIGQASEFDYSGTQACRSLAAAGVEVVLINSNPATIMTDRSLSAKTYIEPITKDSIKKIITKEKVDAVLSTMGGQTALNLSLELEKEGFLAENKVSLLGAKASTIERTEDRKLFSEELKTLGISTGKRKQVQSFTEAETVAQEYGFPLFIRQDFALGGTGALFVHDLEEMKRKVEDFPITLEKSLVGWKEVELEVMVDREKNGVIVCSIENIDPCGVHTGDSITVAPVQTISDECYQKLRTWSLNIAKHMGVVAGGANVQFAINPLDESDIVCIEMNPRVSRSSALASKATGYPIAKISALLALGYTLKDIINDITKSSPVSFEPTLDYVAVKIPQFAFHKFPQSDKRLGPQMRAVGEVLALGGSFIEAFMKALRSLEVHLEIPSLHQLRSIPYEIDADYLKQRLREGHELCLLTALQALRHDLSIEEISKASGITPWFIEQIKHFRDCEVEIKNLGLDMLKDLEEFREVIIRAKKMGMSDKFLAKLLDLKEKEILEFRLNEKITPSFKAVDTCSGEFAAETPYYYSTYFGVNEVRPYKKGDIVIFGSGPNRIGQGIEFDYSCVKACEALAERKKYSIMLNSNPETVSTDYDSSDRLYITPLYCEDVFDILMHEKPEGIISCFSGQTGIQLREDIETSFRNKFSTFNFLGPAYRALEVTEDRKLFSELIQTMPIQKTKSKTVAGYQNLIDAMIDIGFPVIIRPSYVIGGESMFIFRGHDDIHELPTNVKAQLKNGTTTFLVESYLEGTYEYDVDLIRDHQNHCVFSVTEHIEYAGVHSGDSGMITPPIHIQKETYKKLKRVSREMAEKLEIIGPINIQFAIKDEQIYCIEANPRGSRTLPFLSKAYDLSLPILAVKAMLGDTIPNRDLHTEKYFCVKQSTFPFDRFPDDNIILGPKMLSTGETMGVDAIRDHAILKSYLGNFPDLTCPGKILFSLSDPFKEIIKPFLKPLKELGHQFYATIGTANFIRDNGFDCQIVSEIGQEDNPNTPNLLDLFEDPQLRMVVNTPKRNGHSLSDGHTIRKKAVMAQVPCFTRPENIVAVIQSLIGVGQKSITPLSLQEVPYGQ
jgi:carbamoyl-phosphate synthase large subunit